MRLYHERIFPRFYDSVLKNEDLERRRAEHLADVRGDILEIGMGTGLNLTHYPADVRKLTAIEPNVGMVKRIEKKVANSPMEVTVKTATAEALPFDDQSFDSVVMTLVLCSVANIPQVLAEIRRVLRPSGKLYFLEHGLSDDHKVRRWQRRLNPLQRLIGVGCKLDLRTEDLITDAGFEIIRSQRGYVARYPKTHGFIYDGIARRP